MVKMYSLYKSLNLSSVGKRLKKSMQQVSALRQSRYFLNICNYFKNMSKAQRLYLTSHIERTVNVLGESPTKITITNASIDKQITLKRDYIYKIEIKDLEIGFQRFITYTILFWSTKCSRQTGSGYALRINLLNIMIQKKLLRGRGTSIIMKLNE